MYKSYSSRNKIFSNKVKIIILKKMVFSLKFENNFDNSRDKRMKVKESDIKLWKV